MHSRDYEPNSLCSWLSEDFSSPSSAMLLSARAWEICSACHAASGTPPESRPSSLQLVAGRIANLNHRPAADIRTTLGSAENMVPLQSPNRPSGERRP